MRVEDEKQGLVRQVKAEVMQEAQAMVEVGFQVTDEQLEHSAFHCRSVWALNASTRNRRLICCCFVISTCGSDQGMIARQAAAEWC